VWCIVEPRNLGFHDVGVWHTSCFANGVRRIGVYGEKARRPLAVAALLMAIQACGPESRVNTGDDDDESQRGGSSGEEPGAGGATGASPGKGGSGTGAAPGKGGSGGVAGIGGSGGASATGGLSGDGGADDGGSAGTPTCPTEGTNCPDACPSVTIVSGCGDETERSLLCTSTAVDATAIDCGVRLEDGRVFHGEGAYPSTGLPPNPFATLPGFRACTVDEALAASCQRVDPVPSTVTVRFELVNERTTPVWIVHDGANCEPLRVRSVPEMTLLRLGLPQPCTLACTGTFDPSGAYSVTRVEAGATLTITWDGRDARLFDVTACRGSVCGAGALVPSPTGTYQAGFVVETDPNGSLARAYEMSCGTAATCTLGSGFLFTVGLACLASDGAAPIENVLFALPASGEVVVSVPID
jgi:hypothetical protein